MKTRKLLALVCAMELLVAPFAQAASYYWDSNGTTAGAGDTPSGTWGISAFWNTTAAGDVTTPTAVTTAADDVYFSAGTDAVNPYTNGLNSATQIARLVTFEDGTVTLNDGTLSLTNNGGITVSSSAVSGATISSGLTLFGIQTFNVAASRTLTLDTGTFTRNAGATLNVLSTGTITSTMTGLATGSLVNNIIGPWASHGSGGSTKYATIDGGNNIVGLTGTAAATAANVTDTLGAVNYDMAGGNATFGAGANINTLRYSAGGATIAGALTTRGIMNVGGGTLTLSGTVTGTGELVVNTANGGVSFSSALTSGTSSLVKDGSGRLTTHNAATTFTGPVIVNGGVLQYGDQIGWLTTGNITLNGGVIEQRWSATNTKTQGSGAGEIQILGGESGFSENGNTGLTWNIGAITWGSATFNPSKLVLQTAASQGTSGLTIGSAINLNGAVRTIIANAGASGTATSTMGGALTGAGASGLIKEGPGILILNVANSYSGNTTISAGTLRVAATDRLGSASNTLIFNGGTLQASGTITSPSGRSVTMTSTGIIDNNGQAISIAGDISGSGGLTKNGAGTLTLSGTANYGGITTVNAGTLAIPKQASLYNSTPSSWTAANINVKNGATLALNVDSAGTAGFDSTALNTLLGNISVANTAAQGLQAGAILALDTATASGGAFTQGNAIANSTGAFGGVISLTKLGAGTLAFDKANTYTGPTTISAGTLRLDDGGSIAGSLVNNSVFLVNKTGGVTRGTDFPALIGGSGSIALGASTTFTISTPDQFLFSALNTTGGGSIILSGVTTPVFGGLSGATGNLGSIISSGYGSVTALTLNVPSGLTFTYGGVIADGAAGMSLTKTGAGTQILTGNNTYTGITYLNGGALHVGTGSTIGKLSGTTGLTFNGGTLQFNRSSNANIDAINDAAAITVNSSSTFGVTSADAGGTSANETIGAVTLNAGQMNFNWSNGGSSGTLMTLTNLSRSGTASANFNSGFASNNSRWKLAGAGTTTTGQIIGPWYTTGANNVNFASTDYAVYSSDFVAQAAIAGSAENTWTTAANAYTMSANQTLTATRTITALRSATGAGGTLTLATGANLETYGLLTGAQILAVNTGTGGVLTTPTGTGTTNLYVNAGAGAITISAPINNNGVTVTLVKNGSGTLTLSSTASSFSGGVVLNAGSLSIDDVRSIGGANNTGGSTVPITVNGSSTITMPSNNLIANFGTGAITITNGATLTVSSSSRGDLRFGGAVTGSGGVTATSGSFWSQYRFNSTANTFTGAITDSRSGNDGINNAMFSFNSIADGAGYGNIILNGANDSGISYGSGAIAALNLNNRQLILANNNTVFFNNASSQAVNINTDIGFSGTGARQIRFGISGAANHTPGSGINTFAGKLTDNAGGAFTPTFNGGTWVLSGANTYSGVTTLSAGMLSINSLANVNGGASALGTPTSVANGTLSLNGVTLQYTGSGHTSDRVINLSGTTTGATLDASGSGALVLTSALTATGAGNKTLTLTGTSTATNTLGGAVVDNSGANKTSLIKTNTGTWVLSGSNTYTGTTIVRVGTLMGVTGGACASSAVTVTNTPGNISALAIRVTDTNLPWSCSSLAFTTNGLGAQVKFSFATTPSKALAPLSITGNLAFTGAPVVVLSTANVPPGKYPLLVAGGTAPSAIPALDLMGSTMKGSLSWGGTGNKTLFVTLQSTGTFISFF